MSYTTEALLIGQWTPEELEEEHECQRQQETEEDQMDRYIEEQQMIQQMEARDALGIPEPYIDDLPF